MSAPTKLLPEAPEHPGDVFDVVLVSGDAYVDHPAFGAGLIGRYLESLGYRVGILAQPDWTGPEAFRRFGKPRLFFGVSAGNLDSVVAHYTPARHRRTKDAYTPGGAVGKRPDYAAVVYAQRCKEAFPEVPVVMGGIEASLRRLSHYDYIKNKVKGSVLADAKADFLVYGMAERALAELALGLREGDSRLELEKIGGLAYRTTTPPTGDGVVTLPAHEAVRDDPDRFLEYYRELDQALRSPAAPTLVQPHGSQFVVVNPPAAPLSPAELDRLYELPFTRRYPERYDAEGGIPALEPVRFSVVTHRGCYGGCSFCAIAAHQGKGIVSRSPESVLAEVLRITLDPLFRGTIQDVGGPSANMYATGCRRAEPGRSACDRASCIHPDVCMHLDTSGADYLNLLRAVRRVPGVKHAFVASGLRYDLLTLPGQRRLLRELMQHHVGGQMKVAPEAVANRSLKLMGKPGVRKYRDFTELFEQIKGELELPIHLIPYLMTGHPGSDLRDAVDLAMFTSELGHFAEQVQDFTPTPMTRSTCMYHTERDPSTGEPVLVPKGKEKTVHRALAQHLSPENRKLLVRHFEELGKAGLLRTLYGPRGKASHGKPSGPPSATRPGGRGGKPGAGGRPPRGGGRGTR